MTMRYPSEEEVAQVMKELGIDYVLAKKHLVQRFMILDKLAQDFPLSQTGEPKKELK